VSLFILAVLVGCGKDTAQSKRPFTISAIPDQDPERLQRLYGGVATYLSKELAVPVSYRPVTDYTASVTAFNANYQQIEAVGRQIGMIVGTR
jgi:phosphonate transport system substrate-binding protein